MPKTLAARLHKVTARVLALPATILPTNLVEDVAVNLVVRRARRLPPERALKLMFGVDTKLYDEQGHQSVRYGGGVHTKHRHMRYHDFFVDRIESGQRVLDIGCGIGAVAHDIADRSGASVVAIDLDERNISNALQKYPHERVDYRHGDALQDLPDETFDVVVLSNVLEHLDHRPRLLRRIQASTQAPLLLIRVPIFERDWRVPLKKELGMEWRLDADHETEYLVPQFQDEVQQAGLQVRAIDVRWGEIWAEVVPDASH